jgi:hypothetical protein
VTLPGAREALGRGTALIEKWSTRLDDVEDFVWQSVLRLFATLGRPPRLPEIANAAKIDPERLAHVLKQLEQCDLLGVDEATAAIAHAYPFTGSSTGHRVRLGELILNALCAIDALGAGAMYRQDTAIASSCDFCGAEIRIETRDNGTRLGAVSPETAVVWYDAAYAGGCAATSCCPGIVFLCSDDHLRRRLASRGARRDGYRLSPNEALEIGRALFEPALAEPTPNRAKFPS